MTYNFDPDAWYDRELAALKRACEEGLLDRAAFEAASDKLDKDYDSMCDRLNFSYVIE